VFFFFILKILRDVSPFFSFFFKTNSLDPFVEKCVFDVLALLIKKET